VLKSQARSPSSRVGRIWRVLAQWWRGCGGAIERLDETARHEFKKRGVVPTFLGYAHPPYPATICVSVNDEIVHGIPGKQEISDGDIVSIDIGCTHKGFVADMAVTVGVGNVSPEAQRLIDVTKEALVRHTRGAAALA
jgi:methionyl aminopeptidase